MERYPSDLPLPILGEGAYDQLDNLLVDQMAGGNFKSRRRWPDEVPTIKDCTWRLRAADAAYFEGWWTHVLGGLSTPFEMLVSTPSGQLAHACAFISSPLQGKQKLSQILWQYRAQVVIQRLAVMNEDATLARYFAPFDLAELVARMAGATLVYVE